MTDAAEKEWLAGTCPDEMYRLAHRRATTRQIRLYMLACCRLHADVFFDSRIAQALAAVERCADEPGAEAEAEAVWFDLVTAPISRRTPDGPMGAVGQAIVAAWELLDEYWAGVDYVSMQHALAHAVYLSLRERPGQVFTGGDGDAAEICARAVEAAEVMKHGGRVNGENEIRRRMIGILRDIFDNSFRPTVFDPSWRTSDVVRMARGIYESHDFSALPALAVALENAGCANERVLTHFRGPGSHVRGCWAVDLVLGR